MAGNSIIVVSAKGALRFAVYEENTNAAIFIDFCKRLLHDARGPVYLIVDGHPAHRATAVKQYVASTEGRLKLFRLPGYSPELNPDEMSLSQCGLRRSSLAWLSGSLSFEVSIEMPESVQRRRLW